MDQGTSLVPLLRKAISRGIEPEYASKLLNIIETASSSTPGLLSERELEVLKLMSAGLSNQEIAHKLVISPSTAKTHVHNILEKLYARDRLQAVNRARELKLIQP